MITESTTTTANKVIVVGMLDTMLVRDRGDRGDKRDRRGGRDQKIEVTRKAGRTRGTGGRWENLTLQVRSPSRLPCRRGRPPPPASPPSRVAVPPARPHHSARRVWTSSRLPWHRGDD